RKAMLQSAGLEITAIPAEIDERAVEAALGDAGRDAETVAAILAEAKAVEVSDRHPNALVIGSDQTLAFDCELLHKPASIEEARRNLLRMRGRTHQLHSAVALAENGEVVWRHQATNDMTMRDFDPGYLGRYLARIGEKALQSVGSYQVEGEGINLF